MVNPPVALTAMGKPLFNAPDGGYYEIVRVTEDSTQSGLQQGPEISVLVEQKVRPEAFPSGLPMSVGSKIYAISGKRSQRNPEIGRRLKVTTPLAFLRQHL
jgi:hypothetical protein